MISSCQTHFAILDKLQGSSLSQKKILRILKIHSKALYAIKTLYNLHLEDQIANSIVVFIRRLVQGNIFGLRVNNRSKISKKQ